MIAREEMIVDASPVTIHDHTRLNGNDLNPVHARLDVPSTQQEILHRVTFKAGGGGSRISTSCLPERGSCRVICQQCFSSCPCISYRGCDIWYVPKSIQHS